MNRNAFVGLGIASLLALFIVKAVWACCAVFPPGKPVVNADQTVIIFWDAESKTEHFIRQASFKGEAMDFGFLIPTPSQPELSESGNEAFPYLAKITEPEVVKVPKPPGGMGCGCGAAKLADPQSEAIGEAHAKSVTVLQEKLVAGFNAAVLEANSGKTLVDWLKEHGYAHSPEIEAWAKPYVEGGWKITALKVAKNKEEANSKAVAASSLRISFHTDRPIFPYREPDFNKQAADMGANNRLLRIYFVGDARYDGELTKLNPWTGKAAWANKLKPEERRQMLEKLKLPATTGPAEPWLTEFEDNWPYQVAPADLYFAKSDDQDIVKRPPRYEYVQARWPNDVSCFAIVSLLIIPPIATRIRRRRDRVIDKFTESQ